MTDEEACWEGLRRDHEQRMYERCDEEDRGDDILFVLTDQEWDEFVTMLEAPPSPSPKLEALLSSPTVFDKED